jgi:FAD/FMN-containing dehydrogenase
MRSVSVMTRQGITAELPVEAIAALRARLRGSVVLDLSGMRGVQVDAAARTARAEGGARLGDLDQATQAFGLAAPAGCCGATA